MSRSLSAIAGLLVWRRIVDTAKLQHGRNYDEIEHYFDVGLPYTLCAEKTPPLFSFITFSQVNQFAQKFQRK